MVIELALARPLDKLKPIECPQRGGINFACAPCQQCEIGEVTLSSGDGYLVENTVNSILIHLELGIQDDPLEQAALKFIKNSMNAKVSQIQKGKWELGDIQILVTNEMVSDRELVIQVKKFVTTFPGEFRQLMISAKRAMTNWSDSEVKKILHNYFRGI